MRYFIEVSYNGAAYSGFQTQQNANTIQDEVEKALAILLKQPVILTGSSRTDAGVHAVQQFAHFDFDKNFDASDIRYRLNQILPFSISINSVRSTSEFSFNFRSAAIKATRAF